MLIEKKSHTLPLMEKYKSYSLWGLSIENLFLARQKNTR